MDKEVKCSLISSQLVPGIRSMSCWHLMHPIDILLACQTSEGCVYGRKIAHLVFTVHTGIARKCSSFISIKILIYYSHFIALTHWNSGFMIKLSYFFFFTQLSGSLKEKDISQISQKQNRNYTSFSQRCWWLNFPWLYHVTRRGWTTFWPRLKIHVGCATIARQTWVPKCFLQNIKNKNLFPRI